MGDHRILKNPGHRLMLDDDDNPVKVPHLSKRKRKAETKGMRQFLDAYHLQLYREYHLQLHQDIPSEEPVLPEQSVPSQPKGRNAKIKAYKRTKRLEQGAN